MSEPQLSRLKRFRNQSPSFAVYPGQRVGRGQGRDTAFQRLKGAHLPAFKYAEAKLLGRRLLGEKDLGILPNISGRLGGLLLLL